MWFRSSIIVLALSQLIACANITSNSTFDVFNYVNQLIGTNNGGGRAIAWTQGSPW